MKLARHDALPESYDYRDDGCEESPSCLACPLPKCRFDVKGGAQAIRRAERNAEIVAEYLSGEAPAAIGEKHGVARRSIQRIVQGMRDGR